MITRTIKPIGRNIVADQKEIRQFKIVGILHENNPTYYSAKILRGLSTEEKRNIVNATIKFPFRFSELCRPDCR